jgi:hypothetical protein
MLFTDAHMMNSNMNGAIWGWIVQGNKYVLRIRDMRDVSRFSTDTGLAHFVFLEFTDVVPLGVDVQLTNPILKAVYCARDCMTIVRTEGYNVTGKLRVEQIGTEGFRGTIDVRVLDRNSQVVFEYSGDVNVTDVRSMQKKPTE